MPPIAWRIMLGHIIGPRRLRIQRLWRVCEFALLDALEEVIDLGFAIARTRLP
jgi:hypothetical protein